MNKDKHIGEQHQDLTVVAKSTKAPNGYLHYYWCKCSCGNYKRFRYDQVRKAGNCGQCKDFKESEVLRSLEVLINGKK